MSPDVVIVDVFPRDGVQSLRGDGDRRPLSTREKVDLIRALDRAGLQEIEVAGFVHPRVIPTLADAEEVLRLLGKEPVRATTRALVPNLKGAERAVSVGVEKLSCLIVASESYQKLNSNMTISENLAQIEGIARLAGQHGIELMGGIGTSFVCPYEGIVSEDRLLMVIARLVDLGITEIFLADSAGLAWPALVQHRCRTILERWPFLNLGLHLHTLAGLGMACAWVGYECGVRKFDASVGGIGGGIAMPVSAERLANVATEDLVYLFESSGIKTGIDPQLISSLGQTIQRRVGRGSAHVSEFGSLDAFLRVSRASIAEGAADALFELTTRSDSGLG